MMGENNKYKLRRRRRRRKKAVITKNTILTSEKGVNGQVGESCLPTLL